jgi:hypothetical protein
MLSAPPPKQHTNPQFFRHFPLIVGSERVDHGVGKSLGSQGDHLCSRAGRRALSCSRWTPTKSARVFDGSCSRTRLKARIVSPHVQDRREKSGHLKVRKSYDRSDRSVHLVRQMEGQHSAPAPRARKLPDFESQGRRQSPPPESTRPNASQQLRLVRWNRRLKARPSDDELSRSWIGGSLQNLLPKR